MTLASVPKGPSVPPERGRPANAVCEGRLSAEGLAWTLVNDYPAHGRQPSRRAQKSAGLVRALSLLEAPHAPPQDMASEWELQLRAGSAPKLVSSAAAVDAAPTLSLSHSGNLLLAAAAAPGHQLGVDVERLRSRDFQRIETHLGWSEADQLLASQGQGQGPERQLLFYRRWTLAESLYKALGILNLEDFTALEYLAVQNLSAWDTGWRRTMVRSQLWEVRWWRVGARQQAALICLLRGRGNGIDANGIDANSVDGNSVDGDRIDGERVRRDGGGTCMRMTRDGS